MGKLRTWSELNSITGGLSQTSKMPCASWSIPASMCNVGSKLRNRPGSTCSRCYALKGYYVFRSVREALVRRFRAWEADRCAWIEAMADSILKTRKDHFRWFDSGDLQSIGMLRDIVRVCELTPSVMHWLPTREFRLLRSAPPIPPNLIIRASATMIGKGPTGKLPSWSRFSTVDGPGFACPALDQNGECGDCRACWNPSIETVSYRSH